MEKLLENGAKDVYFTPIYMKKNRPAYKLSVLCDEKDIGDMEAIIFKNTTSIGIRRQKVERTVLEREIVELETKYGPVRLKVSSFKDKEYYCPEYDDIRDICNKTGLDYKTIYDAIKSIANKNT